MLRDDAEALHDFLENGLVGLNRIDSAGVIQWANKADYEPLGYSRDAYVGRSMAEFHADPALLAAVLRRLANGERTLTYEARQLCKDGSSRDVAVSVSASCDAQGRLLFARCLTQDITQRARTDAKLRENEDWLQLALEAARMGTWAWDVASNRVTWSSSLEKIYGLREGTFAGTLEASQRDIHPDDLERVMTTIHASVAAQQSHHLEYRIVLRDGSVRTLEAHGRVICDSRGVVTRVVGVCSDVTARKQSDVAREQFISILGHDLRTPLNTIALGVDVLLESGTLPASELRTAERISRSAQRIERMVADLLDLARARLGNGIPVVRKPAVMNEICEQVIDELAQAHQGRKIRLAIKGDMRGDWDADRVTQAVSNLVGNALKHGEGPVGLEVSGEGPEVVLEVCNRGRPIPPEVLTVLFQPFSMGTSASARGLGLGLYIVSEIVRGHGGTISVNSNARDGTRFVVTWPRYVS